MLIIYMTFLERGGGGDELIEGLYRVSESDYYRTESSEAFRRRANGECILYVWMCVSYWYHERYGLEWSFPNRRTLQCILVM